MAALRWVCRPSSSRAAAIDGVGFDVLYVEGPGGMVSAFDCCPVLTCGDLRPQNLGREHFVETGIYRSNPVKSRP